ncbi:DNA-processing protein DprA [Chamaesiphon sp. OTE_75_metabat_556]|uniref:DNA-processing protein DprA n=1 Tax=Chamaesiphon sp. OTE_75_metabat_556 TaxID=2964692 RepID=UPI00286C3FD6|nr:DNA-processing protein DprA [Chamaesiphon sp. OTE_75_metabat_556]
MSQERIYCLAWSRVNGVGSILVDRLIQHFGSLAAAWTADEQALLAIDGIGLQSVIKIVESRAQIDPQQLLATHAIDNPNWWARTDTDYPRLLAEIPSAPSILYYRGQVALAENRGEVPAIAIVGTRSPSEYGKKWARQIATLLAQNGFTVVSGLAQGIDAAAHSACLEAGGRTIAVVGTGVNLVYPPQHHELATAIAQQGLIVSEYVANTSPDRAHFPARNRIIAGLSRVTIVIDAPTKSGALITAYQANDFGRDVYVLPGSIDNPNSIGGLGLLTRGAQPILGLTHLLELLATIPQLDPHRQLDIFADRQPEIGTGVTTAAILPPPPIDVDPELQPIWLLITDDPIGLDELVSNSQLPVAMVSSILLQLELLGLVTQLPGMRYQR